MKILALIPARGGSKRLPGKNLLQLGGKPLIAWSIDSVLGLSGIVDVLVSTDDPEIAKKAIALGAHVPWLRPVEISTDTASTVDVALHALDWYESKFGTIDGLMLLQPTSPLRSRQTIINGIELFSKNNGNAVVGVTPAATHPMWTFRLEGNALHPWFLEDAFTIRSQDLPAAYAVTGFFYLITPRELRKKNSFFPENAVPLIVNSQYESIDIDTKEDYLLAKALLSIKANIST